MTLHEVEPNILIIRKPWFYVKMFSDTPHGDPLVAKLYRDGVTKGTLICECDANLVNAMYILRDQIYKKYIEFAPIAPMKFTEVGVILDMSMGRRFMLGRYLNVVNLFKLIAIAAAMWITAHNMPDHSPLNEVEYFLGF